MPKLRHSQDVYRLPIIQSGMPALRRPHHSGAGLNEHPTGRMQETPPRHVGSVGEAWPPRKGAARLGIWPALHWPGKEVGLRCPDHDETPLSMEEIYVFMHEYVRSMFNATEHTMTDLTELENLND